MHRIIALLVAIISGPALAQQEQGFYVGGAFGQSKVNLDTAAFASDLAQLGLGHTGVRADESDSAWKVFAGFRVQRHLAIEVAYGNLGEVKEEATITTLNGAPIVPGTARQTFEVKDAFSVSALGILPLEQFHLFGRLGFYSVKLSATATISGAGGTASAGESDRSTGLLFGAGAGYDFNRHFAARIEWERYSKVGEEDTTGEGDVDVISIGVLYRF
jgi:OmpA-OmpF porin, OOP family